MWSFRPLTPGRLVRSPAHMRLTLLRAHLSTFKVFPQLNDEASRPKNIRRAIKQSHLVRLLQNRTSSPDDEVEFVKQDTDKLLRHSLDRYLAEARRFADCFGSVMLLDVLYLLEPQYAQAIKAQQRIKTVYYELDHDYLIREVDSLYERLEVIQWRARISKTRDMKKQALKEQTDISRQMRRILHEATRIEGELEIAGCVVARLGLLVRRLRKQVAPPTTRCTLSREDIGEDTGPRPAELRRVFLKKLKKTKRVNFQPKAVRIRQRSSISVEELQDLRSSVDQRDHAAFKRRSMTYHPGKWADKSGCGFVNTSGFRLDDVEWEESVQPLTPEECSPPLSHAITVKTGGDSPSVEESAHETPGSPTEGALTLSMLDKLSTAEAQVEDDNSTDASRYRKLSDDLSAGAVARTTRSKTFGSLKALTVFHKLRRHVQT